MTLNELRIAVYYSWGFSDTEIALSTGLARGTIKQIRAKQGKKSNGWQRGQKFARAYCRACGHIRPHKRRSITWLWQCGNCGITKEVVS